MSVPWAVSLVLGDCGFVQHRIVPRPLRPLQAVVGIPPILPTAPVSLLSTLLSWTRYESAPTPNYTALKEVLRFELRLLRAMNEVDDSRGGKTLKGNPSFVLGARFNEVRSSL